MQYKQNTVPIFSRESRLRIKLFNFVAHIVVLALAFASTAGCSDTATSSGTEGACGDVDSCSACNEPCVEFFSEGRLLSRMVVPEENHALWLFGPRDGDGERVTSMRLTALNGQPGIGEETIFVLDKKGEKILWVYGVVDNVPTSEMLAFEYHVSGEVVVSVLQHNRETGESIVLQREAVYPDLISVGVVGGLSLGEGIRMSDVKKALLVAGLLIESSTLVEGVALVVGAGVAPVLAAVITGVIIGSIILEYKETKEIDVVPPLPVDDDVREDEVPLDLEREENVTCIIPPTPDFGEARFFRVQIGDAVTFSCKNGYTLIGAQSATCGADGWWDASPPICVPDDCPLQSPMLQGRVEGKLVGGMRSQMLNGGKPIGLSGTFSFTLTPRLDNPIADITDASIFVESSEAVSMTFGLSGFVSCSRIYGRLSASLYGVPFEAEMNGNWLPDGDGVKGRWWGRDLQGGELGQGMGSWIGARVNTP